MRLIAIIDYGMGNLRSVEKALELLGYQCKITGNSEDIEIAEKVILPGVGAFGAAITNIEKYGLVDTIKKVVSEGKPILGICLGLQMLFEKSDELGSYKGLGIIKGNVPRFSQNELRNISHEKLKIPHMGWNTIKIEKQSPLLRNIPDNSMVYFVHSFYVDPYEDIISTKTNHGITFCSSIWKDNIFATQFHPEKSGKIGLSILKNFAEV